MTAKPHATEGTGQPGRDLRPRCPTLRLLAPWTLAALIACGASGGPYDAVYVRDANRWLTHFHDFPAQGTAEGKATYYHDSLSGNPTASGELYDPRVHTAAHRTWPFGTVLRVTRTDTGANVIVRVNDRGPFGAEDRILDLSRAAAERIDLIGAGVTRVRAEVLYRE